MFRIAKAVFGIGNNHISIILFGEIFCKLVFFSRILKLSPYQRSYPMMLSKLYGIEDGDRIFYFQKTTLDTYFHLHPDKNQKLAEKLNQLRSNK